MEQSPRATVQAGQSEWTRVIVVAPPADPPHAGEETPSTAARPPTLSDALQSEFERRDWFAVVLDDPYLALAELSLRERAQSARAAWGLQRMEGLALVVVQPRRWPADFLDSLFDAVRRWLPAAAIWTAVDDRIEIVGGTNQPEGPERADFAACGSAVPDLATLLAALPRLPTTDGDASNGTRPEAPVAGTSSPGRLSREEIDMLLHEGEDGDAAAPDESEERA